MEEFKLELFKESYGYDFPPFYHLSEKECSDIKNCWAKKFGTTDDLKLMLKIVSSLKYIDIDDKQNFNIKNILNDIGIEKKEVLINWFRFDNIDRMALDDLSRYFDDIWFPSADDIEIFDESCSWILSVNHGGVIGYLKK